MKVWGHWKALCLVQERFLWKFFDGEIWAAFLDRDLYFVECPYISAVMWTSRCVVVAWKPHRILVAAVWVVVFNDETQVIQVINQSFSLVLRSKKFDDQTQLISAFRGTGVCGVVSFLYGILLPVSGSSASLMEDGRFPVSTSELGGWLMNFCKISLFLPVLIYLFFPFSVSFSSLNSYPLVFSDLSPANSLCSPSFLVFSFPIIFFCSSPPLSSSLLSCFFFTHHASSVSLLSSPSVYSSFFSAFLLLLSLFLPPHFRRPQPGYLRFPSFEHSLHLWSHRLPKDRGSRRHLLGIPPHRLLFNPSLSQNALLVVVDVVCFDVVVVVVVDQAVGGETVVVIVDVDGALAAADSTSAAWSHSLRWVSVRATDLRQHRFIMIVFNSKFPYLGWGIYRCCHCRYCLAIVISRPWTFISGQNDEGTIMTH